MEDSISAPVRVEELVALGTVLGQNLTFGLIAGRCSAAQAEGLRRLRNEKVYRHVTEHWEDFCPQYLRMSRAQADKIIRLWEEFGAGYFELAQLTRVSPETYRALEPAVENGVLNLNGEQIELTIENSRKVAAAVAQVRRALPAKPPEEISFSDRVDRLEKLCEVLGEEFRALPDNSSEVFGRYRLALMNLYTTLKNLRKHFNY